MAMQNVEIEADQSDTRVRQDAGLVKRSGFGSEEMARTAETAGSAAAEQARAIVEARYVMALRRPRDLLTVREKLLAECRRPGFARSAVYRKPVGRDHIEGPSVRFAESALRNMGNVATDVPTVYEDNEKRIVRVSVTDLDDNAPVFTSGASGSVAENAATSTVIYTAQATDADATAVFNTVSYALKDGGDKARLRCPACGWTHWNNPTPVLAAIVEVGGKVLLARNAAWPGKMFALITGFMEAGETPQQGIAREIKEETDLQADTLALIGVYDFQRMNQVIIAYHAVAEGHVRLSPELAEYKMFNFDELVCWPAGTGYALGDWLRTQGIEPKFMTWEERDAQGRAAE